MKEQLLQEYSARIKPIIGLAKKAYGSRNIDSPQHDASREYTRLLVEFYNRGGSLLQMAEELGVTYAGIRRRVTTADIPPSSTRSRSKASAEEIKLAASRVLQAKYSGVEAYHEAIRREYEDNGISLNKLAKDMKLSSSNPLYYAVARAKLRSEK